MLDLHDACLSNIRLLEKFFMGIFVEALTEPRGAELAQKLLWSEACFASLLISA